MADENKWESPSFDDWYENHKSDYNSIWKFEHQEKEDAKKVWRSLHSTNAPIIKSLRSEFDAITDQTSASFYRPQIGYQIQSGVDKAENIWESSTAKLFSTKGGKTMVASSGVERAMTNLYENFEDQMGKTVYKAYADVAGKISGAKDLQRTIMGDIREYERNLT